MKYVVQIAFTLTLLGLATCVPLPTAELAVAESTIAPSRAPTLVEDTAGSPPVNASSIPHWVQKPTVVPPPSLAPLRFVSHPPYGSTETLEPKASEVPGLTAIPPPPVEHSDSIPAHSIAADAPMTTVFVYAPTAESAAELSTVERPHAHGEASPEASIEMVLSSAEPTLTIERSLNFAVRQNAMNIDPATLSTETVIPTTDALGEFWASYYEHNKKAHTPSPFPSESSATYVKLIDALTDSVRPTQDATAQLMSWLSELDQSNTHGTTETSTTTMAPTTAASLAEHTEQAMHVEISERALKLHDEYVQLAQHLKQSEETKDEHQSHAHTFDHLHGIMEDVSRRLKEKGLHRHDEE